MNYTTKPTIVRYSETDQMQFVHHSNYLKYFEMARLEWLSSLGVSYANMEKQGIMMPIVSVKVDFKKPLFFGDEFQIIVSMERPPASTLEFDYQIINHREEKICEGNTVLAFFSSKIKRPIRCPEFLLEKFN